MGKLMRNSYPFGESFANKDAARTLDWLQTSLKEMPSWSQGLRSAISILLPSKAQIYRLKLNLLISDIGMPEMDDCMLMLQIRLLERGGQILAIALTAYAGEYDQQKALSTGFQQDVAKPIEPTEIVTVIACLWRRNGGKAA